MGRRREGKATTSSEAQQQPEPVSGFFFEGRLGIGIRIKEVEAQGLLPLPERIGGKGNGQGPFPEVRRDIQEAGGDKELELQVGGRRGEPRLDLEEE